MTVTTEAPAPLVTNIAVPSIVTGRHALHFLPDRVLVRDGRRFAGVWYSALRADASAERFIESERPPRDGHQVDTTWRYVKSLGSWRGGVGVFRESSHSVSFLGTPP
ncbi:MAG TPA: hypothetical protein VNS09_16185 [Solirubrobacter sp.]|nr:hypothetical protein [Solirubrobacter sp.]